MQSYRLLFYAALLLIVACANRQPVDDILPAAAATGAPPAATWGATPLPGRSDAPLVEGAEATRTLFPPPARPSALPTMINNNEPQHVLPSDPRLGYIGRFDFSDPDQAVFDWSGSAIMAAFTGSTVSILLRDGRNLYNVLVDGQASVLQTVPGQENYLLASDLGPGRHTLRLTKRTEAFVGPATFLGLVLAPGHTLLPWPQAATRHILFFGDSITAGYGNEGVSPDCWFTPDTENVSRSFAGLTASYFGAEATFLALSGLGVVRNLSASTSASPETAIAFVGRTVALNPFLPWDPGEAQPAAVVVNLGTNDFSTLPFPEEDTFVAAYIELLRALRASYPQAHIFALAGPLMLGPAPSYIATAVDILRAEANDERLHYVLIEDNLERSAVDMGCDWHPNVHGHQKIALQLQPAMSAALGW